MSYGKAFEAMYTGSMFGSPALVYAIWGYVIANMREGDGRDLYVELNPTLLGATFATDAASVREAIGKLEAPDPKSRTKAESGRRLVLVSADRHDGPLEYRVVNGSKYREMRNEEARREQNRDAQRRFRAKNKNSKQHKQSKQQSAKAEAEAEAEILKPDGGGGTAPPLLTDSDNRRDRWVIRDHVNKAAPPRGRHDPLGERIRFDDWFPNQQLLDWCRVKGLTDADVDDTLTELRNKISPSRRGDVEFWDLKVGRFMVVSIDQKSRGNGKGGARQPDRGNVDADEFTRTP